MINILKNGAYGLCLFGMLVACTPSNTETKEPQKDSSIKQETVPATTKTLSPEMQKVRNLLVGDWEEDTVAFKNFYKMPPPPAQNCKVRWQDDGWVYIPGVLLTQENWDRWELVNDSTIHVKKRQTGDVRVFVIDDISPDSATYRMIISPDYHRRFKLAKLKK